MHEMTRDDVAGVYDARAAIEFDGSTNRAEIETALSALEALAPSRDLRILDVGCGQGWFLTAIAAAGYRRIYGMDISSKSLRKAAKLCSTSGAILIHGDVATAAPAAFDIVVALNACLGCFGPLGDQQFLDGMFRALVPDGRLLLTFIGPEAARRRVGDFQVRYSSDSEIDVVSQVRIHGDLEWLVVNQKIGDRPVPEERIRIFAPSEVNQMLGAAGFDCPMRGGFAQSAKALEYVNLITAAKPR
jgi:SAM-dependent methyltransferase